MNCADVCGSSKCVRVARKLIQMVNVASDVPMMNMAQATITKFHRYLDSYGILRARRRVRIVRKVVAAKIP
jgi:hypothetical protein